MQINVQNSRFVRDNLTNLIQQDSTDILFIQEKYLLQNKIAGIPRAYRNYISKKVRAGKPL